jgi:hypothetical protein
MFYLLLILPHVLAIGGLLAFALCSSSGACTDRADEGTDGGGGGGQRRPPTAPQPAPPRGGLPLGDAQPPWRRLRVGEQLSELYQPSRRRDRGPHRPPRTPAEH